MFPLAAFYDNHAAIARAVQRKFGTRASDRVLNMLGVEETVVSVNTKSGHVERRGPEPGLVATGIPIETVDGLVGRVFARATACEEPRSTTSRAWLPCI